jgi:GAF domain-containing protein
MSETLIYTKGADKSVIYKEILPQIEGLLDGEADLVANMANITAVLKEALGYFWVGFYLVKGEQLVLGPFQGSVACTRIKKGKGVCGKAWEDARTILVPDVDQFEGHIACSSLSRSEIVIPIFHDGQVIAVLDIDSEKLAAFDEVDALYLERIGALL